MSRNFNSRLDILPPAQQRLWPELRPAPDLGFVLYGGTAISFDDERLVAETDYDQIINALNLHYGNPRYLLFDEIQNLPRWELFVQGKMVRS